MQLLDLPTEIFECVLRDAILVRGRKRGLRLRLVNKALSKAVLHVICTFRLLEHLPSGYPGKSCTSNPTYRNCILVPYLTYHITHAATSRNPLLMCLKEVAIEVQSHSLIESTPLALEELIQKISSSLPDWASIEKLEQKMRTGETVATQEYDAYLFTAAIRSSSLAVLKRCHSRKNILRQLIRPEPHWRKVATSDLAFRKFVAMYASFDTLQWLLLDDHGGVNREIWTHLFIEAARIGRTDTASFVYSFRGDGDRWWEGRYRHYPGIFHDAQRSPSREVIELIDRLLPLTDHPESMQDVYCSALVSAARHGRLDTIKYLIKRGVPATGRPQQEQEGYRCYYRDFGDPPRKERVGLYWHRLNNPIEIAVQNGDTDIMEYLLEQGAAGTAALVSASYYGHSKIVEVLLNRGFVSDVAILKAAASGYTTVLDLLLDHSVDIEGCVDSYAVPEYPTREPTPKRRWTRHPLVSAVEKENTTMFKTLMERLPGARAAETMKQCVLRAKADGLESMLTLLFSYGVDVERHIPILPLSRHQDKLSRLPGIEVPRLALNAKKIAHPEERRFVTI